MNIWVIKANEPMPIVNKDQRLFRMGMINNEMIKRGHDVTWFSTTFDHFTKKQLFEKDTIIDIKENYRLCLMHACSYKKNISIKRIINHKSLALKLKKKMKKMEKPDLIYVAFPTIDFAEQAVMYGEKYNVPVIIDVRDLWPDIFKDNLSGIKKIVAKPYINLLNSKTKRILKGAYAIFSITPAMLDWGLEKAGRRKKQQDKSFYIGYENKDNYNFEPEYKERFNINKNYLNVVFAGTVNNQYNYDVLVETAKLLQEKDIMFHVCGDGPNLKELKERTKNLNNIKYTGWIEKKDLIYILNNCDIGFANYKNLFNFKMNITNKFAEFLSYGLPIVVTVDGYMAQLANEKQCGFFSTDPEQIAYFLLEIKQNKDKYDKFSTNAKNLYKNDFTAEDVYSKLVNHIEMINNKYGKED